MSRIESSTLIAADTAPEDASDVWAPATLFLANWVEGIEIQHEWPTASVKGKDGYQTRWGFTDHPIRVIKGKLLGMDTVETWRMFHQIRRMGLAKALFPLYSDHTKLLEQVFFQWSASSPGITGNSAISSGERIFNFNEVPSPAWDATQDGIVVVVEASDEVTTNVVAAVYDPAGLPAAYRKPTVSTYTATGTFAGFTLAALMDGFTSATPTTAQMWATDVNTGDRWATIDFGTPRLIQKFRWWPRPTGGAAAQAQSYGWVLLGSNDASFATSETLITTVPFVYVAGWNEQVFVPTEAYRYYRVRKTTDSGTTQGHLTFVEIEFYDWQGLISTGSTTYTIPNDAIVLAETTGDLHHDGPYSRTLRNAAITDIYSTVPSYHGETVDTGNTTSVEVAAEGFDVIDWSQLTQAKIESKGWPDADDGTTRLKFYLIPWGTSSITVSLDSPATLLCDTTFRRFFPGGLVAVGEIESTCHGWGARFRRFHTGVIESMGDDFLALQGLIPEIYAAHSRVYPLMEVELVLTSNIRRVHSRMLEVSFLAREITGRTALLPVAPDNDPLEDDGYNVIDEVPVVDWRLAHEPNLDIGLDRDGEGTRVGQSTFVAPVDPHPRVSVEREWTVTNREDAWRMLRLWERSGGNLRTFWSALPVDFWSDMSLDADEFTVTIPGGHLVDWEAFTHLMFRPLDTSHTAEIYAIDEVTQDGDDFIVHLATQPVEELDFYQWVRPAYLMQFSKNVATEKWMHDQLMSFSLGVVELINDEPVVVDIGTTDPGPEPQPDPLNPANCEEARTVYGVENTIASVDNDLTYREYGSDGPDDMDWQYAAGIVSVHIRCLGWDEDHQAIKWEYSESVLGFGVALEMLGYVYGNPLGQPFDIFLTYNHGTINPPTYWDTLVLSNA